MKYWEQLLNSRRRGVMRLVSRVVPVHFSTAYREDDESGVPMFVRWWQWRDRIWGYRAVTI